MRTLRVWRREHAGVPGGFERHSLGDLPPETTLLEALDVVNERLVAEGKRPIAFDSDCREGICGACGMLVDGEAHGPASKTPVCQLTLRHFAEDAEIRLEPFAAAAFPPVCDLTVDRSALDRVIAAGGFVSVHTGAAPDANALPIAKRDAERALDAAECIGCGACVAACPNASAALFVGAKLTHLALLPQGAPERGRRALEMVRAMDAEGFGGCSLHGECSSVCPKGIDLGVIGRMNREWLAAAALSPRRP
jgi:succinate dehydrogenase / fumarate reductase iron-sulfur subunit